MGSRNLRAVVIGAGWAGKGHIKALQHNGVEVIAICARQKEVVEQVASNLGVANASINWRETLITTKPDIVALATPARLRRDVIELATQLGSHILCEKPLATTLEEAHEIYRMVTKAKIKHAYTATLANDPGTTWLAELLANESIGQVQEVDLSISVPYFKALTPWSWMDSLSLGGGSLNNALPHFLGSLEKILAGKIKAVVGEARVLRNTACYQQGFHDFRQVVSIEISEEEAAALEWRDCDADNAFSALVQVETELSDNKRLIPVVMRMNFDASLTSATNGWYFYGDKGVLVNEGLFSFNISKHTDTAVESLPIPPRLLENVPPGDDAEQLKWSRLIKEFVADICNEPYNTYLTFEDGWRYQKIIDAVRFSRGWHQIISHE